MKTSLEEAMSFVETNGIVLESAHGRVLTFAKNIYPAVSTSYA